jgi:general secretion pathway protein I
MSGGFPNRHAGFSLLEVLVALSILALSYGTILQLLGSSSRNATRASEYRQALMVAESQLTLAATVKDPAALPRYGAVDDKFAWTLDVTPDAELTMSEAASLYVPLRITVQVSWDGDTRSPGNVSLSTVRIGPGGRR